MRPVSTSSSDRGSNGRSGPRRKKTPYREPEGVSKGKSGVDLLSHTVKCNIIGAVPFHGPVRDGKGWYRDAMDTRLKGGATGWGDLLRGLGPEHVIRSK